MMGESIKTRRGAVATRYYYYNLGDEKTAITGDWIVGYTLQTGSQSKEADHLFLGTGYSSSNSIRTYVTDDTIDITNIDRLYVNIDCTSNHIQLVFNLRVSTTADGLNDTALLEYYGSGSDITISLDVSSLTGSYYISVMSRCATNIGSGAYSNVQVYKVWGE